MSFDSQPAFRDLRDVVAERTDRLIAWVGAGLSAQAGLPTWTQLRRVLEDLLRQKVDSYEEKEREHGMAALEQIRTLDHWNAFERIEGELGPTSFRESIRKQLSQADRCAVPTVYKTVWELGFRAVLTLNMDRLATRAFSAIHPGTKLAETDGWIAGRSFSQLLGSPRPFVVNLHGHAEDYQSWVMTRRAMEKLTSDEAYRQFVLGCLSQSTMVFLGITADDQAIGGFLDRLRSLGVETGPHYWITDRRDGATDKWAEERGIRVIRYDAPNENHDNLNRILVELGRYVSKDDEAEPVGPTAWAPEVPVTELALADELLALPSREVRDRLNVAAKSILARSDSDAYAAFAEFCRVYDEAIYRAWYVTDVPPQNDLLGYEVKKFVARGGFGRVFEATDRKDGGRVAVKVMLEEIRSDLDMLQSFRRGVRSMKILAERDMEGVVRYLDASEIPAFVAMDWVDGPNLRQAVEAGCLRTWQEILRVAIATARIIRSAHNLPERVLHRDLRPSNIMLENFWVNRDEWSVKVLDFDLSWHVGATERSVVHSAGATGYLAPEQMIATDEASTRNAAVDSFGFGMTMFYMVSARDPLPAEHRHAAWPTTLRGIVSRVTPCAWKSLPRRIERLLVKSTLDRQASRWDMSQILAELERLGNAVAGDSRGASAELWCEELMARGGRTSEYEWNDDALSCHIRTPGGVSISARGDEVTRSIALTLEWTDAGIHDRRRVGKWIPNAMEKARSILAKGKWQDVERYGGAGSGTIQVKGSVELAALMADPYRSIQAIEDAIDCLTFS